MGWEGKTNVPKLRPAISDRVSIISGGSRPSVAPSMMLNDYSGKKSKIIQTCRQIDEGRTGVVKVSIFLNLLNCLEVELSLQEFQDCFQQLGVTYEGIQFIKYEPMLR